ncbi:terpenoid synthase [Glonium stellatum]|uniref:geranylgeranyl diphosphate synthase n=1 Tax=Glonium stellatum TaxID=574774 RepID=A0A8E2JUB6_9PEZI|nr:terpenoid synthase [Glonium stellatum]
MDRTSTYSSEEETSSAVRLLSHDTQGFCQGYDLRQHKYKTEANHGSYEARLDWSNYIGPIEKFGGCNPFDGHFASLVLPLCKPERLRLVSYILMSLAVFLYDSVLESATKATLATNSDNLTLSEPDSSSVRSVTGTQQIQAKMILELMKIDRDCTTRILGEWKKMVTTTTKHDKAKSFKNIEDYVAYRTVDTGAPFVEAMMLWGMGMLLTEEEDRQLEHITFPCYTTLGLANNYFSFAKELVRNAAVGYENSFQRLREDFEQGAPNISAKLRKYLAGLSCQISGNVVWSLNCPRYHPESNVLTSEIERSVSPSTSDSNNDEQYATSSTNESASTISSICSSSLDFSPLVGSEQLGKDTEIHLNTSHGVRDTFVDALNVWLGLPERITASIKRTTHLLHSASLMLDDIEDSSELRRGQPATHTIFGTSSTINSANYIIIEALDEARNIGDSQLPVKIFIEELRDLHIGQSYDLYWTRNSICPLEDEYLAMVAQKTGGLFRLLTRLLIAAKANMAGHESSIQPSAFNRFVTLIGRYFQIRDDYQNLNSPDYSAQKGFCEDLDEGKYSYPLIHALKEGKAQANDVLQLRAILQERRDRGGLSLPLKKLAVEHLQRTRSFEYTLKTLKFLEGQISAELSSLESMTGCTNWIMRLLIEKLKV